MIWTIAVAIYLFCCWVLLMLLGFQRSPSADAEWSSELRGVELDSPPHAPELPDRPVSLSLLLPPLLADPAEQWGRCRLVRLWSLPGKSKCILK
jgi:hypothetical protein